jgi:hypothetical protein
MFAVEAPFRESSERRRGLSQSQRRVYPLTLFPVCRYSYASADPH